MFFMTAIVLSLAVVGAVAAPLKRASDSASTSTINTSVVSIPNFGNMNATYIPVLASAGLTIDTSQTVNIATLLPAIQSKSEALVSAVGTATVMDMEAGAVFAQATSVLGPSQTDVSVFIKYVGGTPVVEVSSGATGITLATGTGNGGVPTAFAGHTFLAAPAKNGAFVDQRIPRSLLTGMAIAVGSVIMGVRVVI